MMSIQMTIIQMMILAMSGEFAEDEEDIESQTCTDSDDSSKKE